jgi:hypothetical protein
MNIMFFHAIIKDALLYNSYAVTLRLMNNAGTGI